MSEPTRQRTPLTTLIAAAAACLLASNAPLQAQTHPEIAPIPAPAEPEFLSRYDFQLSAAALNTDLAPFKWEAHFGGDVDLFDYVFGRASIVVDLEAVLGDEFRPFDPNQNNYSLEGSASARIGTTEVAAVFHHVSRHLSDRPKRFPVAWNVLGARVLQRVETSGFTFDIVASGGKIVQNSFVDYTWIGDLDLLVRRPLTPTVGVFAHGVGEGYLVDPTIAGRDRQLGGRIEVGLRLSGRAGALEVFAGGERRVDADPIDRMARDWALAGFRLVSK
jgi:hypothetical protein